MRLPRENYIILKVVGNIIILILINIKVSKNGQNHDKKDVFLTKMTYKYMKTTFLENFISYKIIIKNKIFNLFVHC
jgi:hypothetical protein